MRIARIDALPVKWSQQALEELADVINYIEQYNFPPAVSLHHKLGTAAQKISSIPHGFRLGRIPGTREMVINPNYLLVYQVTDHIRILTVLHARRKYP